jgi:hypothetical protein
MRVWAILPSLPLGFWTKEALEAIVTSWVSLLVLSQTRESKVDRKCTWIQIEVDVHEGLVGNLDLVFGEHT